MQVVCIVTRKIRPGALTKNKIYEVLEEYPGFYRILDDNGFYYNYIKERFITIQEHREQKLKRILK